MRRTPIRPHCCGWPSWTGRRGHDRTSESAIPARPHRNPAHPHRLIVGSSPPPRDHGSGRCGQGADAGEDFLEGRVREVGSGGGMGADRTGAGRAHRARNRSPTGCRSADAAGWRSWLGRRGCRVSSRAASTTWLSRVHWASLCGEKTAEFQHAGGPRSGRPGADGFPGPGPFRRGMETTWACRPPDLLRQQLPARASQHRAEVAAAAEDD
jgi:hypothetical protein